ncbi:MAG: hypothetical protein JXJ17_00450 [Anaerolineae bacterium]|nr:hypothetical protein [Anaerolineae bacterium]
MTIPVELLILVTLLVMLAAIARPFFSRDEKPQSRAAILRRRADLLEDLRRAKAGRDRARSKSRRDRFDERSRELLKALADLPRIDESPEADPVEAAVEAVRSGGNREP